MVDGYKTGRKPIYTNESYIDENNIVDVLSRALNIYSRNKWDINYLYNIYCGKQDIRLREKTVRPEINNKIAVNYANEIVTFKTGYFISNPIKISTDIDDQKKREDLIAINRYLRFIGKENEDFKFVEWLHICGVAYQIVVPYDKSEFKVDGIPFHIYTLDPRFTFVVRSNMPGNKVLMAVQVVLDSDDTAEYYCWTKSQLFKIKEERIVEMSTHTHNRIPIVEFKLNSAMLGSFEIVLPMLNAINELTSNRADAVEQFVQSLMIFCNCDIDEDTFKGLKDLGALKYRSDSSNPASVEILTQELNQEQTQTLQNWMYSVVLTICGMPNRNGGSSTSDTGKAVIYRDGYEIAAMRAAQTETMVLPSEIEVMSLILNIYRVAYGTDLKPIDLNINFPIKNYEDLTGKVNIFATLLNTGYVALIDCFRLADLDPDPVAMCERGEAYHNSLEEKETKQLALAVGGNYDNNGENGKEQTAE